MHIESMTIVCVRVAWLRLSEVHVKLTLCPYCVCSFVADGKFQHAVPRAGRNERAPSPMRGDDEESKEAQSAAEEKIKEVLKNAKEEAAREMGGAEYEEEEGEVITLREGPDAGTQREPEYREYQRPADEGLPRPIPFGDTELISEMALSIDTNYPVTLQFDVRMMKALRKMCAAVEDRNCFAIRQDVIALFATGKRHDAMGNSFPIVDYDSTGFPRKEDFTNRVGMPSTNVTTPTCTLQ